MNTGAAVCKALLQLCCEAMRREGCVELSRAYVAVGQVAWDDCDQLTVGPERVYRYTTFPGESFEPEYCGALLAVTALVTLTRCVPSSSDSGTPPSADQLQAAHTSVLHDGAVLWNAVTGPVPDDWERAGVSQTFLGNHSGLVAIETRLTVGTGDEWWC